LSAIEYLANAEQARRDGYEIPDSRSHRFFDDYSAHVDLRATALDRLVGMVLRGEAQFDRIYVRDRSRLGRWVDPRILFRYERLLAACGVSVLYLADLSFRNEERGSAVCGLARLTERFVIAEMSHGAG
jgi:hypothetical protein